MSTDYGHEYAAAVWSPSKQLDIDSIENVQRRATKQIPSDMEYPDRLKKLKMPTLNTDASEVI